jgi:UDP-2,3-diacylglucosamine pyrophosphatase LpxH
MEELLNVAKLSFDYTAQKMFIFGLMSDIHLDAKGHDKSQFDSDMSSLCGENARMTFNGDTFDAILPTDRKRYSRSGDISKHDAQINDKVNYAFNRLRPYSDHIDYFGYGNHEISVIKYNNVDPLYMWLKS